MHIEQSYWPMFFSDCVSELSNQIIDGCLRLQYWSNQRLISFLCCSFFLFILEREYAELSNQMSKTGQKNLCRAALVALQHSKESNDTGRCFCDLGLLCAGLIALRPGSESPPRAQPACRAASHLLSPSMDPIICHSPNSSGC